MTDTADGSAGIREAKRRFDLPNHAGRAEADLQEGDAGHAGMAEAERRFSETRFPKKAER